MDRQLPSKEEYFMGIALAVRAKANCIGRRVGSIIVKDNRIIATGYNGTPAGMPNCLDGGCSRCSHREDYPAGGAYDLCICVHAEQNAILAAARFGIALEGGSCYSTLRPCFNCLKEMIQVKIQKITYLHPWQPDERSAKNYHELETYFPGGVHRLEMADPDESWAMKK